jgi:hypothetical protein
MVAVSFIDAGRVLDLSSIRLFLDNVDHTPEADINADVLVWNPATPLRQGVHSVVVTMRTTSGTALPTVSWSFLVGSPPEGVSLDVAPEEPRKGVPGWARLRGNLTLEGSTRSIGGDGAEFRREAPAASKAWLNLNGQLGGSWRWTGYAHMSSYESQTRQPINRFRFNLRSKALSLAIGDINPNFQELILWGRRVRGWSFDLRGGFANLAVVSGQSRRSVDAQLFEGHATIADFTQVFRRGAYAQDLLAIRPYFGSGERFQFGITVLKVRDNVNSITDLRTSDPTGAVTNFASVSANALPKDNLVLGTDISFSAFGRKLNFRYDNAFSLYANDISGGALSEANLDSLLEAQGESALGLDPSKYEDIFILNASLIPIDITGLANTAHQIRSSLQLGTHTLGIRWRRVGGSYYTLGQTSLQRDRSGLRVQDTFSLFQNALAVTVGWENYDDNVNESKFTTTGTSSLTLDLMYQQDPNTPGFALGYRSYGRQNDLTDRAQGGIDELTSTYSAGAFLPVNVFNGVNSRINMNFSSIGREDGVNPNTGTNNTYYLLGLYNRFLDRPTEFSVTYGLNTSELTGFDAQTTFNRVLVKGRHGLSERLYATADLSLLTASSPASAGLLGLKYSRTAFMFGGEYYWTSASYASLRAGYGTYRDDRRTGVDTSEFSLRLRLVRGF